MKIEEQNNDTDNKLDEDMKAFGMEDAAPFSNPMSQEHILELDHFLEEKMNYRKK